MKIRLGFAALFALPLGMLAWLAQQYPNSLICIAPIGYVATGLILIILFAR